MIDRLATAEIKLTSPRLGNALSGLSVPEGFVAPKELLPAAQKFVECDRGCYGAGDREARGKNFLLQGLWGVLPPAVPISEVEARHIAELVASLPEPGRSQVRVRFEEAARRLAEARLLEKLRQPERWSPGRIFASSAWNTFAWVSPVRS